MVKRIETIYPNRLNKGFSFGSRVQHETPEEGQRTYQRKHYEDEDISPNIVSGKNYHASSQKFRQCFFIPQIFNITMKS